MITQLSSIFTAIGTVGAVIVSLTLSYRANKIKANKGISFNELPQLPYETRKDLADLTGVTVTVTNIGEKPFKINSIVVKCKYLKQEFTLWIYESHPVCTKLGHFLLESETGYYIIPESSFINTLTEKLNLNNINEANKCLKNIKFIAITNLGQNVIIKPGEKFCRDFADKMSSLMNRNLC